MGAPSKVELEMSQKLQLLEKWVPAKKWMEATSRVKSVIEKWKPFQEKRKEVRSDLAVISLLWKPTGFDGLVDALNRLGNIDELKEAAEKNFKELCDSLDKTRKKEVGVAYSKREEEAIESEISRIGNQIKQSKQSEESEPLSSEHQSAPNSPGQIRSRTPSPQRDENWEAPAIPSPVYQEHATSLGQWIELKEWEEMVLDIKEAFGSWKKILQDLTENEASSKVDIKKIDAVTQAITESAINTPSIEKQIETQLKANACEVDAEWGIKGKNSFMSEQASRERLGDLPERLLRLNGLTPKPSETVKTSEDKKGRPEGDKEGARRKLFPEEDTPKRNYFGLATRLLIISVTALLLIVKRQEISKWFSRQFRKAN